MRPRVTLRLEKRKTGLAAVWAAARPRAYEIRVNSKTVGHVAPLVTSGGWYFSCASDALGIPWRNTSTEGGMPLEQAKADALAYVRGCLAAAEKGGAS